MHLSPVYVNAMFSMADFLFGYHYPRMPMNGDVCLILFNRGLVC